MHPSMPEFSRVRTPQDHLAPLDPDQLLARAGASDRDPIDLLEVQLETATAQLRIARDRLVRSRRRVAELQEVVDRVQSFLDLARRRCSVPA